MIYVFREDASDGARQLAEALGGRRIRTEERMRLRAADFVVAWGEHFTHAAARVLNGAAPIRSKFTDAETLRQANVRTIEVARQAPRAAQPVAPDDPAVAQLRTLFDLVDDFTDFSEDLLNNRPVAIPRTDVYRASLNDLQTALSNYRALVARPAPVAPPAPPVGEWVGRTNNHTGGRDLLAPPRTPDYFVKKETFANEYRVHSFLGRSIRAGKKVHRTDFTGTRSPWVRSWDGGWKISYDGASVRQRHRDIAHAAVRALGLDFGAVDIGETADGTLIVLEVNRAPGLEGGTVTAYANAIQKWSTGEWTMRQEEAAAPARRAA